RAGSARVLTPARLRGGRCGRPSRREERAKRSGPLRLRLQVSRRRLVWHSRRLMPDDRPSPLIALRHRNYRLLWSSQLVSNAGSMMQGAAILWHISLLVPPERRGLALGMVGLVRIGPIIAFSILSGAVAEALERRTP